MDFAMITEIVTKLGIPIASALVGGFFIFLILKYILESVTGQVDFLHNVITSLDNRVKTMNNDIIRIDTLVSSALGLAPDTERIARADGKIDDGGPEHADDKVDRSCEGRQLKLNNTHDGVESLGN